jgi:23S rRNA pseudouridine2605 synthase
MAENTGEKTRLNKYLASRGLASRRKADELILAGQVRVNGVLKDTPGVLIDPLQDRVEVAGRVVGPGDRPETLTIVLHKPPQVVSTVSDPQGRQTVLDLLPRRLRPLRLYPVGRLDYLSEGLLLLTNDGELCQRLTHPSFHLPKVYEVAVRGQVQQQALAAMRSGMRLAEGETTAPAEVEARRARSGETVLTVTLIQGLNRQLRRMCRDLGLSVLRLRRVRQGPVALGRLESGAWRPLDPEELAGLRRAVGLAADG